MTTVTDSKLNRYDGANWLEKHRTLSPFGVKVANILGQAYKGIYHISSTVLHKRTNWKDDRWIEVVVRDSLGTYDGDLLTFLVLLCHQECVRLEIRGAANGYLSLCFSRRQRDGALYERHPTIEQQIERLKPALDAIKE